MKIIISTIIKGGVRVADKEIYVCRQHYNATLNPTETLAAVSS